MFVPIGEDDDVVTRRPSAVPGGRRLRSSVATLEIAGLSAGAHTAAGGPVPDSAGLLWLVAATGVASAALRHRIIGTRVAVALAVLGQVAVHTGLSLTGAHAGHAAHTATVLDPSMLLAHAVGAAFTVAAFLWQEQVLVALGRTWTCPATTLAAVPREAPPATAVLTSGSFGALLARAVPRRGPPVLLHAR